MATKVLAVLRAVDTQDVCSVTGFSALVYGVSQYSAPAGWMTAGTLLLIVAIWPTVRRVRKG